MLQVTARRAVLAVLAAATLAAGCGGSPPRPAYPSAEALADAVGVNVHMGYPGTAYTDRSTIVARLRALGVRHIRDGVPNPRAQAALRGLGALRAAGLRADVITGTPGEDPAPTLEALGVALGSAVDAVEGPNEPDISGLPDWPEATRRLMAALRRGLGRTPALRGATLVAPSVAHGVERPRLAAAAALASVANVHVYPGGEAPERALASGPALVGVDPHVRSTWITETGYDNAVRGPRGAAPVPEAVAAAYIPRLLLECFRLGFRRTYLYELADERPEPALTDRQQHFGLLRSDLSPKPAFTAVATLLAFLRAGDAGDAGALQVRVTAPAGAVHRLVLRRADGSLVVALWPTAALWDPRRRRVHVPPAVRVHVALSRTASAVLVRPDLGPRPLRSVPETRDFDLRLRGGALLVGLGRAGVTGPPESR